MSDSTLGRYYSLNKSGIDPRLYPDEPFYYYNLPDFDTGEKVALSLGKSIDSNKFLVQQESLLISKLNPRIKRVWLVRNDGRFRSISSTEFVNLIPNDTAVVDYLFYFLQQDWLFRQLESEAVGTTNSHVRFKPDLLCRIPGELPSTAQQRKIARILTTVDNLIEKTEALIAKYQAIKQGMMHDLFTRGVDEHGHLRPPYEEAPELYKQSELGWIPKEWKACNLGHVASLQVGYAFKSSWFRDDGGFRLLRGENVGYGRPDWSDAKFLPPTMARQFNEYTLQPGDVVIGMDRTFTKTGVKITQMRSEDCPVLLVQRVGRFLPRLCESDFLRAFLGYERYHADLARQQKGMDIPHLSQTEILEPLVPVPPNDEQHQISDRLASLEASISSECENLEKMTRNKTGLMQDLLTGKVRVKVDDAKEVGHV